MGWKFTLSLFAVCALYSLQLNGQTDCGSSFFDLGGSNGNYANNELAEWTFCPDEVGDLVTLTFTAVAVESCCDNLSIFNGTGTGSLLELDLESPETFTSSADDGCLTVTWSSDVSITFAGWEATISCAPPPPCPDPVLFSLVNATSSGAVFQWNQVGDVVEWELEIVPAGTPPTGVATITNITASPYTWEDGTSGTDYDVYIRGLCAPPEEFTNWVGPLSFSTNPACGDFFYDSGGPDEPYQVDESQNWLFCPDNPGDQVTIAFLLVEIDLSGDQLGVYNGTGTDDPWEADLESPNIFSSNSADGCLTVTWSSDGFGPLNGWVAFISCNPPPPCPNPSNLTATNITTSGANFNWTEEGESVSWNIEIVEAGMMATGTPTIVGTTDNPFVWEDGESGTTYEFYVQADCGTGEETSNWIGPSEFTTTPACGDSFFDSGGSDGSYQNNELETWLFCPDNPGDLVTLNFVSVAVESCCDDLSIYNGSGTGNPLELDLENPEIFTSSAMDGCLTVTWDSDGSVTFAGWEALISCSPPPPCPNPVMLSLVNATSTGAIIQWNQTGDVVEWEMEIIPAGEPATGIANITNITASPYTWEGGDSNTEYDVYIRGLCENAGEFTNWVGPLVFRTNPACGDNFYDPGGPNGDYTNNLFVSYTFCPDEPGDIVVIDFTFVDVEGCCDELAIYNGSNTDDPLEFDLEGPATFTSTAADGCLTVTFDSDGSVIRDGWEAIVLCTPCPPVFPQDISTGNIGAVQADVLINTNIMGGSFMVEVDTAGFIQGAGAIFNGTGDQLTLTGLTEDTDYEFYLTYICPDGQEGPVLGPFSFTTVFANDLGITALLSPNDDCGLGNGEPIRIAITNFGADPQTLFPLNYAVNGVLSGLSQPQDGFFTGIISRDSTEIFEFDLIYDFTNSGEYIIQIWTEMMDDTNPFNDTLTIILNKFAPPLYEDFESGTIPAYFDISFDNFLAAPGDHTAPSWVLSSNLFSNFDEFLLDFPVLGPIAIDDTLYFDYRYVDFFDGTIPTQLGSGDSLLVMASLDCGETYEQVFALAGDDHEPTLDMRTLAISLEDYEDQNIKLRITAVYGGNYADYFLDIDNINLYRCEGLDLEADVIGVMPGMDDGQITIIPGAGIGPYEYLWGDGSTEAVRTDLALGNYMVTVTDRGGCVEELTVTVDVFVSNEELPELIGSLQLAPNPTRDQSIVRATFTETVDVRLEVVNLLGQSVWRGSTLTNVSEIQQAVDMSQLPTGIYLVRLYAGNQIVSRKLMKTN